MTILYLESVSELLTKIVAKNAPKEVGNRKRYVARRKEPCRENIRAENQDENSSLGVRSFVHAA